MQDSLKSVMGQRRAYPNIEIIFVDDGSTDNSYAYALSVLNIVNGESMNCAIKLPQNMGVGTALNVGFAAAKGDYLCFFAADDILLDPQKTLYQQVIMETTGADLSYYLEWYEGLTLEDKKLTGGKWAPDYLPIGYLLKNFLHMSSTLFHWYLMHHDPINSGSFMITRKAYQKYGKWNDRVLTTDYDLLLRYCKAGAKFCPIKGAPVFYRLHAKQSSYHYQEMADGMRITRAENQ